VDGKSLVCTVINESAITYAVLKMWENSDQEDKDSNFPTMHKTILQHVLIHSHSSRTLTIRWKCQTLHTIWNQTNLFKMETHFVGDGSKLKCVLIWITGVLLCHRYIWRSFFGFSLKKK